MNPSIARTLLAALAMTASTAGVAHVADEQQKPKLPPGRKPLATFDRVRYLPAPKAERAMVGGKFSGSNTSASSGFEVLAVIKDAPSAGQWSELTFPNTTPYRWIRYEAPDGSSGQVSKIEFFSGQERLNGPILASFPAGTWRFVLDDKPNKGIAGPMADDQFVGIDIGERASAPRAIIVQQGGEFSQPVKATIKCAMPDAVIGYTTDGTVPTRENRQVYSEPIPVDKTTTITAVAFGNGLAPSPATDAIYLFEPITRRTTLHLGNSLTGNALGKFELHLRTAGIIDKPERLLMGGGITRTLWNTAMIGPGDSKDEARWKDLFTTSKSMGGVAKYSFEQVEQASNDWKKLWPTLADVSDVTFQPRDADVAEEADYTIRWLKLIRAKFPDVQPWLYIEWDEMDRVRATDKAEVPSSQMKQLYPALTWEESMSAMMLYGEEVERTIIEQYPEGKRPRIIPVALAMGRIHHQIQDGLFPGVAPEDFYPFLFNDRVHVNPEASFLVDAVWYAAMFGRSPVGKLLPVKLNLTPDQARAMQELAWDVVRNYPDCGLYEEGNTPCGRPVCTPGPEKIDDVTRVTLSCSTPGAWFRYTLDGTEPTRTRGYIYCGAISVRPGMTVKAIAYQSGMADSPVAKVEYDCNGC